MALRRRLPSVHPAFGRKASEVGLMLTATVKDDADFLTMLTCVCEPEMLGELLKYPRNEL